MDKIQLYIIRHGETEFNKHGIIQGGGIDSELNEIGKEQALEFYKHYKHIEFDRVYTSFLQRTHQSVEQFILNGVPHSQFADLNEMNWGIFEGKRMEKNIKDELMKIIERWKNGETDLAPEEGESPNKVAIRVRNVIDTIVSDYYNKTILICVHGRLLRVLLCVLNNIPLSKMEIFPIKNLGLYIYDYHKDTKTFHEIESNKTDHLMNIINSVNNSLIMG